MAIASFASLAHKTNSKDGGLRTSYLVPMSFKLDVSTYIRMNDLLLAASMTRAWVYRAHTPCSIMFMEPLAEESIPSWEYHCVHPRTGSQRIDRLSAYILRHNHCDLICRYAIFTILHFDAFQSC